MPSILLIISTLAFIGFGLATFDDVAENHWGLAVTLFLLLPLWVLLWRATFGSRDKLEPVERIGETPPGLGRVAKPYCQSLEAASQCIE